MQTFLSVAEARRLAGILMQAADDLDAPALPEVRRVQA
jgi:hypothetical protein